jgi:hypothetical protein
MTVLQRQYVDQKHPGSMPSSAGIMPHPVVVGHHFSGGGDGAAEERSTGDYVVRNAHGRALTTVMPEATTPATNGTGAMMNNMTTAATVHFIAVRP